MDGRQRAVQARRRPQFLEGQIGFLLNQRPQLVLLPGDVAGPAARAVVLRPHVAGPSPLLEEFLDHAQGNPKTAGHRFPGAFARVIRRQNPFAQIQGDCLHLPSLPSQGTCGTDFI